MEAKLLPLVCDNFINVQSIWKLVNDPLYWKTLDMQWYLNSQINGTCLMIIWSEYVKIIITLLCKLYIIYKHISEKTVEKRIKYMNIINQEKR